MTLHMWEEDHQSLLAGLHMHLKEVWRLWVASFTVSVFGISGSEASGVSVVLAGA